MLDSLFRLTGRRPVAGEFGSVDAGRTVWEAPFALVSHGTGADPVFNYGNLTALSLFDMEWAQFVRLPSRLSAEAVNQQEREMLLQQVSAHGFIDDYSGVRISSRGERFRIEQAIVWNVTDVAGHLLGQAALFDRWSLIEARSS